LRGTSAFTRPEGAFTEKRDSLGTCLIQFMGDFRSFPHMNQFPLLVLLLVCGQSPNRAPQTSDEPSAKAPGAGGGQRAAGQGAAAPKTEAPAPTAAGNTKAPAPEASGRKKQLLVPFGAYHPDMGGIAGALWMMTWSRGPEARVLEPSVLALSGVVSTRGNLVLVSKYKDFALARLLKFGISVSLESTPASFFGLGPEARYADEEEFTSRKIKGELFAMVRLATNAYAGFHYAYDRLTITERQEDGQLATGTIPGADGGNSSSMGLRFEAVKKDSFVYPRRGYHVLSTLTWNTFTQLDRSRESGFAGFTLDARGYYPVFKECAVALRGLFSATSDTPPFFKLPSLGGQNMRGYYGNRFMDRHLAVVEGELRFPLFWRLRGAVFAGAGEVAHTLGAFAFSSLQFSGGGGLRVVINKKTGMVFRVDAGVGLDGELLFYASFGEIF